MKHGLSLTLLLTFLWPTSTGAQSPVGEISGMVRSPSGGAVSAVELTAAHLESGRVYSAQTDASGRYAFLRLPRGAFEIQASYQGIQASQTRQVQLETGQSLQLDLTLELQAAAQTVTVTGDPTPLDITSAHVSSLINRISMETLPVNGRSLEELALLAPGVVPVRAKDPRAINGFTQTISSGGSRGTTFILDGLNIQHALFSQDTPGGVSGLLLGMDSVEQFEILQDAYPAYIGGTGGPLVNVVSRRGTRNFHGSAFWYYRDSALDARNFFDAEIPPFDRHQFGGSLGGPLPGEENAFFFSYEGLRERLGRTLIDTVPDENARLGVLPSGDFGVAEEVRPILERYPFPNGQNFGDGTATYRYQQIQPTDDHHFTVRGDFGLRETDSLFVRYSFQDSQKLAPILLTIEGFDTDLSSRNHYLTVEETHVFSPRLLNTLQFGFNRSGYEAFSVASPEVGGVPPLIDGRPNFGRVNIRGLTSYGTETADLAARMNQFEVAETLQWVKGRHDLQLGLNWKHYRSDGIYNFFFDGLLIYENLEAFLTNNPQRFQGAEQGSDARRQYRQNLLALFLQDQFRINPQLTLSYGLRWDYYTSPSEEDGKLANLRSLNDAETTVGEPLFDNPSATNISPRLGLAWNVDGTGNTVVRTGFGLFFDPIRENIFGYGVRIQPPFTVVRTTIRPPYPNPSSGTRQGVPRLDPIQFDLSTPYVMRYHLTLQQVLAKNLILRVAYLGSRGVHLPRVGDINTPVPESIVDGKPFWGLSAGPRRNTSFDLMRYTSTDANSVYNALQVSVNRRWETGLQFDASYTYGRSIDDSSGYRRTFSNGLADVPPNYYNRTAERGLSNFHLAHHLVVHYTWDLPFSFSGRSLGAVLLNDWTTTGILTVSSGVPFNVNVSFDRANNRVREGQRPDLVSGADNNPVLGGPDRYFDVSSFSLPEEGFLGDAGRNTLIGPGYAAFDLGAKRSVQLNDDHQLQFRLEVFNLFNRANFSTPQNSATGGIILFNNDSGNPVGNAATIFSTTGSSRQIQIGLRWTF